MYTNSKKEYVKPVSEVSDVLMDECLLNGLSMQIINEGQDDIVGAARERFDDEPTYGSLW